MTVDAAPYILLLATLFGTSLVASRYGVGQFSPLTYSGLRLTLASLGHVLVYLLALGGRRWPTDGRLWRRAAFLGLFDTALPMSLIALSLQHLSSGLTAILATVGPAITVLLAHFFLPDERLSLRKTAGVALAFGGTLLLGALGESGLPEVRQANPIGYLLVLGAMASSSAMTIYTRRRMRGLDSFQVTSVRMFVATLVVMPLSLLLVGFDLSEVTWHGYSALGYSSLVGTFFGFWLFIGIVQRFGATAAATTLYVSPVITGLAGVLVLGETITTGMLLGVVLIAAGLAVLNQRPGNNKPAT